MTIGFSFGSKELAALIELAKTNIDKMDQLGLINAKKFGVVGNGIIDDTESLQKLIDTYKSKNVIVLPPGEYKITSPLRIPTGCVIKGFGYRSTIIRVSGAINALNFTNGTGVGVYYVDISDIFIDGNGSGKTALNMNITREARIHNIRVQNFELGLYADAAWSNHFDSCTFSYNKKNAYLEGATNDINFINCVFDHAETIGFHFDGDGSPINLIGCVLQENGEEAIIIDKGRAINIIGCYFELNNKRQGQPTRTSHEILFRGLTQTVQGALVEGCTFFNWHSIGAIGIDKARGVVINGGAVTANNPTGTKRISTTANTANVVVTALYVADNLIVDDDKGIAINNLSTGLFSNNVTAKRDNARLAADTISNTGVQTALMQQGIVKFQIRAESNGEVYVQHLNTTTNALENIFRITNSNVLQMMKTISLNGNNITSLRLERMSTRPSSPYDGQTIIDSSLNKIIFYDGTNWRDASGTIV